jgi:hypothetical protein
MPRASAKRPKIDPDAKYRSWTSFASDAVYRNMVITKGTVLLGSHPVVQALPERFIRDDTDPSVDEELEYESRWFKPAPRTNGDGKDV